MSSNRTLTGDLLGDDSRFSLDELCQCCRLEVEQVVTLVEEGIVEPSGSTITEWHFGIRSLRRARTARRLQRDLGINAAGAALAIELLERIAELERQMR